MTSEMATFGQADRFGVALEWIDRNLDSDPRPAAYGWSMGRLGISVSGVNLTASGVDSNQGEFIEWYLGPFLHWLAGSWIDLLHQERFTWPDKDVEPAAIACRRALARWAGSEDERERKHYAAAQSWYARHGLRSAAAGGLFPDLFIRRVADDIELSWSGESPPFAVDGFSFMSGTGVAEMAVADVAEPLWTMLQWVKANPPAIAPEFQADWETLCGRIDALSERTDEDFELAAIPRSLLRRVRDALFQVDKPNLISNVQAPGAPYVPAFSPMVAMFGGLTPTLSDRDIGTLRDVLVQRVDGEDGDQLAGLVKSRHSRPVGRIPHEDGYDFARELLDDLEETYGDCAPEGFIDVRGICVWLGIEIREQKLDTDGIRGVALAGKGFNPAILVNLSSPYNVSDVGRRFTIAHELCHILFDRSRARRVAHSSGPWAPSGIEKRANAFAAYFLMPPNLIRQYMGESDDFAEDTIQRVANRLVVGKGALIEHLFNRDFIDDTKRKALRIQFGRPAAEQ